MKSPKEILIDRTYNGLVSDAFKAYRDGKFGLLRHYFDNRVPIYLDTLVKQSSISATERMKLLSKILSRTRSIREELA